MINVKKLIGKEPIGLVSAIPYSGQVKSKVYYDVEFPVTHIKIIKSFVRFLLG